MTTRKLAALIATQARALAEIRGNLTDEIVCELVQRHGYNVSPAATHSIATIISNYEV